jgi:uncharacterized protein involved in type VI secretion and phage assembly
VYDLLDERDLAVERKRLYGVYPAEVTDIKDPDGQGRVKIRLPWSPDPDSGYEVWARLATLMGGNERGTWFIPDPGDEVLALFEGGDPRRPYVVGALWNGRDRPPQAMDGAGQNNEKVIASRRNIRITLDDSEGRETITIETPGGQMVKLSDSPASIELSDSNGNTIRTGTSGISIETSNTLSIDTTVFEMTAAIVNIKSPMSKFSGITKSDTVLTTSTISTTYMPGVGNLL